MFLSEKTRSPKAEPLNNFLGYLIEKKDDLPKCILCMWLEISSICGTPSPYRPLHPELQLGL